MGVMPDIKFMKLRLQKFMVGITQINYMQTKSSVK